MVGGKRGLDSSLPAAASEAAQAAQPATTHHFVFSSRPLQPGVAAFIFSSGGPPPSSQAFVFSSRPLQPAVHLLVPPPPARQPAGSVRRAPSSQAARRQRSSHHEPSLIIPSAIHPSSLVSSCFFPDPASSSQRPDPARSSQIRPNPARSDQIQPHPATSSHIRPDPATSSHIHPHPARSGQIQPHPAKSSQKPATRKIQSTQVPPELDPVSGPAPLPIPSVETRDGQTLLSDLLPYPDGQIRFGLPIKLNMEDDNSVHCGVDLDMNDNVNVVEVEDEYHEVGQEGEVSVSEKAVKDEINETDVVAPTQKSEYKFRATFDKLGEKDSLLAMEGPPTVFDWDNAETLFNESKGVEATEMVTNELHKMFKIYKSHSTPSKASNVVGECNKGKADRCTVGPAVAVAVTSRDAAVTSRDADWFTTD
ncbi:hypothetical protein ACLOJK_023541 [Asimina triloba]